MNIGVSNLQAEHVKVWNKVSLSVNKSIDILAVGEWIWN
jgi:hypothetical protein